MPLLEGAILGIVREWLGRGATWRLAVQHIASVLAGIAIVGMIEWIVTGDFVLGHWDWYANLFIFVFLVFTLRIRHRIFRWVFLAIPVIFLIWGISASMLASQRGYSLETGLLVLTDVIAGAIYLICQLPRARS